MHGGTRGYIGQRGALGTKVYGVHWVHGVYTGCIEYNEDVCMGTLRTITYIRRYILCGHYTPSG